VNAIDPARFESKLSKSNKHYFVLKAGNHEIIGQSEMYNSAASVDKGIESVKKNAAGATVDDQTA